jgi:deoxyribodipyrimidine photo-lyase
MRTLVWFRGKDLRVHDHPPLLDAIAAGEMIPLFVIDPSFFAPERARQLPHRIQFLLESLAELSATLAALGSRLIVVEAKSVEVVPALAERWRVDRVVAHRWVEPFARERDRRVAEALRVPFTLYEGETLLPPGTLRTSSGAPYSVFTPFSRAFMATAQIAKPLPAPRAVPALPRDVTADQVPIPTPTQLGIERNPNLIEAGEKAARNRIAQFANEHAAHYDRSRDHMADEAGTSRVSQDVKFGTLSARTLWHAVDEHASTHAADVFRNELIWREFTHSTLWDRPDVLERPFRKEFEGFPWRNDEKDWMHWAEGKTGYPVVDAAARQLLATGFVHNRARMIAASFLTKHLMLDYRRGEAHYMRWLTDGDWAQNNFNWQWSAGCGCDAQPWFRIFNPRLQGEKFDPNGEYVRRWVPELARLPGKWIHAPHEAPEDVQDQAGIRIGAHYPAPIVDHAEARERFLDTATVHTKKTRRS